MHFHHDTTTATFFCKSSPPFPFPCILNLRCKTFHSFNPKTSGPRHADGRIKITKKKSIWINPDKDKSRVSNLPKYGNNPKYSKLMDIALTLEACEPSEEAVLDLLDSVEDKFDLQLTIKEAISIIDKLHSWKKAYLAFKYFKAKEGLEMNLVLYNVTLKVLRKGRQWDLTEKVVEQLVAEGLKPDNITFSTVISCARMCRLPHKAVEWFERMCEWGCVPDDVTYSAIIDAYGKGPHISEALCLYAKARPQGWRTDALTFSTLIKQYSTCGNYKGATNTYKEMRECGVKPNLVIFNTMIDAMGRARKPRAVRSLQEEMIQTGFLPNRSTFRALITAYGRAQWPVDAFQWFEKMKESGWELDIVVYNTLLNMCAHLDMVDDAFRLFGEICESQNCKPDNRTYNSMITICANTGDVDEAEKMLNEMAHAGYEPDVFSFTSLIQGFGKVKRFDDVVRIFEQLLQAGVAPEDPFCECLLFVLTQCTRHEFGKVIVCVEKADSRLASVARSLIGEVVDIEVVMQNIEAILADSSKQLKKSYCNCLIDLCWIFNFPDRAHKLLNMGTSLQVYTQLQSKSPAKWSLNLKTLSFGAAAVAIQDWVSGLSKSLESGEELPPAFRIHTGRGKYKFSRRQIASAIQSYLRETGAPFDESPDRPGLFLTTQETITSWLQSINFS